MMWEFITVTDQAYAHACHGTCPMALDPLDTILGKPLKGSLPDFALAIGVSDTATGTQGPGPEAGFFLV
jgi:hypothetical protein